MKQVEIIINGESYPCMPTMGAMVRFAELRGKEVTEISQNSVSDMCAYLYCCVVGGCKREKKPFNMTFEDFADSISLEDLQSWTAAVNERQKADSKKKKEAKQ